jgi:hypothetical protein
VSDERAHRVGLNEAIFRQVNEQIRSLDRNFGTERRTMTVICECGHSNCAERLEVRAQDLRARPRRQPSLRDHEGPRDSRRFEQVVEHAEGYDVVRKDEGAPAELSRELDPRS